MSIAGLRSGIVLAALFIATTLDAAAQPAATNILVIMTDDQGRWALGAYDDRVATPNIDHLARSGVRFDRAIAPTPVCSAARASFHTGRTASQHGVHDFLSDDDSTQDNWLAGERLLSEVLSERGYQVGLFGKWHADTEGWRPVRGFDRWLTYDERDAPWINQYLHRGTVHFSSDGAPIRYAGVQAHFLTAAAVEFIDAAAGQAPFAALVNFVEPHFPFAGLPERLVARYRPVAAEIVPHGDTSRLPSATADNPTAAVHAERVAQYLAAVTLVDEQVGRLLDALESRDLLDSTLVIFTSDHGHMTGQYGLYGKGNATLPQNLYEYSLRIPLVISGPGALVKPGQQRDEFVTLMDLFPTLAGLAGADSALAAYDGPGMSLLPLLRGEPIQPPRPYQFAEMGNARSVSDGRWKLVRYYQHDPSAAPAERWYDLSREEGERAASPPPGGREAQAMRAALDDYFDAFETTEHSGRGIWELPRHNASEPWRQGARLPPLQSDR